LQPSVDEAQLSAPTTILVIGDEATVDQFRRMLIIVGQTVATAFTADDAL